MEEINSVVVEERMKPGDFVLKEMRNTDINLVATNEMSEIED
jgi:CxxC motif-containing protein